MSSRLRNRITGVRPTRPHKVPNTSKLCAAEGSIKEEPKEQFPSDGPKDLNGEQTKRGSVARGTRTKNLGPGRRGKC